MPQTKTTNRHSNRAHKRLPQGKNGGYQLLLIHNVEHLGRQGDIVEVKPGYALNFLLPQGLATVATEHHSRMVEKHREKLHQIEGSKSITGWIVGTEGDTRDLIVPLVS